MEAAADAWARNVRTSARELYVFGLWSIGGFALLFFLWGAFFPLASAVVAVGSVTPAGNVKAVQHQHGGAIAKIHMRDGDFVRAGDPIVTLDPIVDRAELDRLKAARLLQTAIEARLVAELDGAKTITFPDQFYALRDGGLRQNTSSEENTGARQQIMMDQISEFEARRQRLDEETAGLQQQKKAIEEDVRGLEAQRASLARQRRNLKGQLDRIRPLVEAGHYARNQADELERQFISIQGDSRAVQSELAGAEHRIGELKNRVEGAKAAARAEVGGELSEVRGEIASLEQQITAAGDVVSKREIKAPVDGILTKSSVHAVGEVVGSGDVIAEIVPAGGHVVSARIPLQDIDNVQAGQEAEIVVTAFNRRLYDPFDANVEYVAADAELDERTGEEFFQIRLTLAELPNISPQLGALRAGMQCEVYITTGKRSFFEYVFQPVVDSYRRAFREE
ncbi:MAG: HlyD family type I secretion periplasmic adaptor subunit [Pseudomonadota bacterium]